MNKHKPRKASTPQLPTPKPPSTKVPRSIRLIPRSPSITRNNMAQVLLEASEAGIRSKESSMVLTLPLSLCSIVLVAADPALFEPDLFTGVQQQLRGPADLDPFGDTVEEDGRSEKWLRDISTRTKNHFKKLLQPLQTPIVQEYQVLTILDGYVNYTMQLVANATGHEVVWNRTGRWLSEEPRALRPRKQELPPRARYINKILLYLNKEMEVVWNLKTIVDRKRWGVGNVITSSPYGPHGEHPERWRANGSFPLPTAAPNNRILLQDRAVRL